MRSSMARHAEVALHVHADDRVPLLLRRAHKHAVAHKAGVVHHRVQAAEGGDGLLHEPLAAGPVGDVVGVGDGLATGGNDLRHHLFGGRLRGALAVERGADVVHHNAGAGGREGQRMFTTDATACARDDDHSLFTQPRHRELR